MIARGLPACFGIASMLTGKGARRTNSSGLPFRLCGDESISDNEEKMKNPLPLTLRHGASCRRVEKDKTKWRRTG